MTAAVGGDRVLVQLDGAFKGGTVEGSVEVEETVKSLDPRWSETRTERSTRLLFRLDDGRLVPSFLVDSWSFDFWKYT